jgi:hypothetical protein
MIASVEAVILSLLAGPAALYLLWRWALFSARLPASKQRPPQTERAQQFNEDSPSFGTDHGPG